MEQMEHRRLENMRAAEFNVSGTRKVACVVSSTTSFKLSSSKQLIRKLSYDITDLSDFMMVTL